jgi:hypothetical protein
MLRETAELILRGNAGAPTADKLIEVASRLEAKREAVWGVELIGVERDRQMEVEGWTLEHDDAHANGILALAAAELAAYPYDVQHPYETDHCGSLAKHKHDPIRRMVIAGALIAAEIDRLIRATKDQEPNDG